VGREKEGVEKGSLRYLFLVLLRGKKEKREKQNMHNPRKKIKMGKRKGGKGEGSKKKSNKLIIKSLQEKDDPQ